MTATSPPITPAPPPPAPTTVPTTVVTCVEYGPLEAMAVRMATTLRRWGGRWADVPVYAVQPRLGVPVSRATRRAFDALGVEFLSIRPRTPYGWFRFLNKSHATMAVAERATTDQITWLDADLLVVGDPDEVDLRPGEDLTACASDKNAGSTGPGDRFDPFWQAVAAVFGRSADQLPWVTDERTGVPIRLYFNSGVFTYRRSTDFARLWHDATIKLLEGRVRLDQRDGLVFHEQIALGLAALDAGLTYRAFGDRCNWPIGKHLPHDRAKFAAATVLHYHGYMWPDGWDRLLGHLRVDYPAVHDWLAPLGPVHYSPPLPVRAAKKVLDASRKRRSDAFETTCRPL